MKFKQTINFFSAWTVDRLTSARRATLTTLATFLIAMTAQTAWAQALATTENLGGYDFTVETDTEGDYYVIDGTAALNALASYVNAGNDCSNKRFKVTANIDYEPSESTTDNYTPIAANNGPFKGHFDGNDKTISGIRINSNGTMDSGNQNKGIFGDIYYPAEVKNVTLANTRIIAGTHAGGIAGANYGGIIDNCHVTSTVTIKGNNVMSASIHGGIVGYNFINQTGQNEIGIVRNCISEATLSSSNSQVGGIAGKNEAILSGNFVIGATIPAVGNNSHGAIVGYNNGTLTNNYYSACTVGGVKNATNVGVGVEDLSISNPQHVGDITTNNGAVVDEWGLRDGNVGSEAKPYTITTTAGLDLLAQKVNGGIDTYNGKFFKLGADIEYDGTANNFTPIGIDDAKSFYGTFDGNGKTISGINIYNSDATYQGVFGYLKGTVKNLVVSDCSIVAWRIIGAIAGYLGTATIENCSVSNNVTLSGSGGGYVGGIVGSSSNGTIKGCVSAAAITGTISYHSGPSGIDANHLGGIAGAALTSSDSKVTDNLFTGTIDGDLKEYIGAIVGESANGGLDNNLYTSAGFGGIGAEGSATGFDGAGAHKAVEISAAEGVTITPTGEKTTYNVSGITAYTDNNFIGYDSKLYAGATTRAKLSITYTVPEGYIFDGIDAGEGVKIVLNEGVYNLAVPASGNVTISPKLKDLTLTLDKIVEFETLAIDENMQSYVENGALKLKVTPKNKFWTLACGVDLLLPEGIVVYKARMNSAGTKVDLTEISDSELNGVLKANNGVLIASTPGESYEFKVSPDNSVTTLSTADAKSYGNDNQLVPVLEETHFDSENYFILTDNQFVMVDVSQDTKVPVGKAVLKVPAGTAQARAFGIDGYDTTGDTTGINAALENAGEEVWYNLQGQRISKPTRKGIYILNGKKVRM